MNYDKNYQNVTPETLSKQMLLKNGTDSLVQCRVATTL